MKRILDRLSVLAVVFLLGLSFMFLPVATAQPSGGTLTEVGSETQTPDAPGSDEALAGNVTNMNIYSETVSNAWQGYTGGVTGNIVLENAAGDVFYNWTAVDPKGQIYASENDSLQWAFVQCLNYTAEGTFDDDTGNAGGTSLFGINLTQINAMYGITDDAVYAVNETFDTIGGGGHPLFYVGSLDFTAGECQSTTMYTNSEQGTDFHNVLLYEPQTQSVVFTAIIEYQQAVGFDGNNYDFQMIVGEDGSGTDTATTTYYFYAELA